MEDGSGIWLAPSNNVDFTLRFHAFPIWWLLQRLFAVNRGRSDPLNQTTWALHFTLPTQTPGPPPHCHEMHDETFLVTSGTVRFPLAR